MSKTVLAVASVAVIALSSACSYYLAGRQRSALEGQMAALQENVQTLQQQLDAARQDVNGLRTNLADRKDENTSLRSQVETLGKELAQVREDQIKFEEAGGPMVAQLDALPELEPEIMGLVGTVLKKVEIGKEAKPDTEAAKDGKPATGELNAMGPEVENAVKEALKNGNMQVKRFTFPGGGEAQVMIQGAELEKNADGKVKIKRFEIPGGGQGQIVIQMEGLNGLKEKKAEPPPKVPEQF
jgi:regulator of replication initiation timing